MEFAQRLRKRRIDLGLSQADLAGESMSASYVSMLESGRRAPTRETARRLAERLDVDADFLLTGVGAAERTEARLLIAEAELLAGNGSLGDGLARVEPLVEHVDADVARAARAVRARLREADGDLAGAYADYDDVRQDAAAPGLERLAAAVGAARCAKEGGDLGQAVDICRSALATAEAAGLTGTDEHVELVSTLVGCCTLRGDVLTAAALVDELVALVERVGSPRARGATYWNASVVADAAGRHDEAVRLAERAVALVGEGGDPRSLARVRTLLGWALLRLGDAARSVEPLTAAHAALAVVGTPADLAYAAVELGRCRLVLGEPAAAVGLAEEALGALGPDDRLERATALVLLAAAHAAQAAHDDATAALAAAETELSGRPATRSAALTWRECADVWALLGRPDRERAALHGALGAAGLGSGEWLEVVAGSTRP